MLDVVKLSNGKYGLKHSRTGFKLPGTYNNKRTAKRSRKRIIKRIRRSITSIVSNQN